MQWLLTHMWVSLLLAGFLGLLAGFGARGFFVSNRVRRAEVDRDVAKTELQQTRAEVDDLYAAQRKHKDAYTAEQGTRENELLQELNSRDTTINNLSNALKDARDELKRFADEQSAQGLSGVVSTAGAAVAGAAIAATATASADAEPADGMKLNELTERNTWLEARVASLETELSEVAAVEPVAAAALVAEPAEAPEPAETNLGLEKMQWQNAYLRQRVEALEGSLIAAPTVPAANVQDAGSESPPALAAVPDASVSEEETSAADEELARLRWRNRYLEGRLAYYEEGQAEAATPADAVSEEDTADEATEDHSDTVVALATPTMVESLTEAEPETSASEETENEAEASQESEEPTEPVEEEPSETVEEAESIEETAEDSAEPEVVEVEAAIAEPEPTTEDDTPVEVQDSETAENEATEVEEEETDSAPSEPEVAAAPEAHPSEAVLQELGDMLDTEAGLIQPVAIEKPSNGADDLTAIGGIGPRIATVLNDLGIWTYEQVAAWTEENQLWVDDHLAFNGRVARESWVEQAKSLNSAKETVDA
ncbi:MAG: hypothetical protein AAFZ91_05250 [Pseudomonadota bacterium]